MRARRLSTAAVAFILAAGCKDAAPPAQSTQPVPATTTAATPPPEAAAPTKPAPTVGGGAEGPLMAAHGKIIEVTADHVTVDSKGEPPIRIAIASDTNVQVDGKKGTAAQLAPASEVHVAFRTVGNVPTAVTIPEAAVPSGRVTRTASPVLTR